MKYLNLVSYFGGKYPHLKWLISQFPKGNYHFIDMMCGAANVALNVNYPFITVNDLNDEIINLFKVLRDHFDEFTRLIYFTPFSRSELYHILESPVSQCPIERARQYFVRCQMGYGANGSQNNQKGFGGEYTIQRSNYYRVDNWNIKLNRLSKIVARLRKFQIESVNALELVNKLDHPQNILYFDPPYLLKTRTSGKRYYHEVDQDFHYLLAEKVQNRKSKIAISGYDHPLYDELFDSFQKIPGPRSMATVSKREIKEYLWVNYEPNKQIEIFN